MKEPVALVEAIKLLIVAVITGGQQLNVWDISGDQKDAIIGIYLAASVVLALVLRSKVTPVVTVPTPLVPPTDGAAG